MWVCGYICCYHTSVYISTTDGLLLKAGSNCIQTNEKVFHGTKVIRNYTVHTTHSSYNEIWNMISCPLRVCGSACSKRDQNSKLKIKRCKCTCTQTHKIQLKYILYIEFDCLNVDELLSVCFHMNKQNGNSILWSRQMLNDHHQIDPTRPTHIYENQECLPFSAMQKKLS